jgi:ABC-2 type transport system permease protein
MSNRIGSVIKREIKVKLGWGFVMGTIFIPLIMAAIVGLQILMTNLKSENKAVVTVVFDGNAPLRALLKEGLDQEPNVKSGLYAITYEEQTADNFPSYLEKKKEELLKDDDKGIFFVPRSVLADKKMAYYSANPGNIRVRSTIGAALNKALNLNFFAEKNIQNVDIKFIQTDVDITGNKVTSSGTSEESWGPIIIGGVLALLLNLGITFNVMPLMNVIVSEKSNRLYELLLTSLKPGDIMWGKIMGTAAVATLQMVIWIVAFILLMLLMDNFGDATATLRMEFHPVIIAYYVVNFVVGLMIFLTLYAGFSSMYDNPGAASSALLPLYFVILLPMYTVFSLLSNPANIVSATLSLIPITSLYVMPARMTLIDVPFWQPLVALALNVVILYFANVIASKIYRISVLSTGNNPSLRQIAVWVRNN